MDGRTQDKRIARVRDRDQGEEHDAAPRRRFICPTCRRSLNASLEGTSGLPRFFPFCSERCKLIDLGAWFDADYRIPAKPGEESEESADPGPGIGREPPEE